MMRRLCLGLGLLGLLGGATACTKPCDPLIHPECRKEGEDPGQATPKAVVLSLERAYKQRNTVNYAKLLASDFQFWFDPATRSNSVPEFWTRLQDSTGTGNLFAAEDVSDIRIDLTYGADVPDNTIGHDKWRKIRVTDTFLEVDKVPPSGEVTTLRVDGDVQDFYFRRGRTPGDTLASSPTAKLWYLVEWHDLARLSAAGRLDERGVAPAAVPDRLWGSLKEKYRSR